MGRPAPRRESAALAVSAWPGGAPAASLPAPPALAPPSPRPPCHCRRSGVLVGESHSHRGADGTFNIFVVTFVRREPIHRTREAAGVPFATLAPAVHTRVAPSPSPPVRTCGTHSASEEEEDPPSGRAGRASLLTQFGLPRWPGSRPAAAAAACRCSLRRSTSAFALAFFRRAASSASSSSAPSSPSSPSCAAGCSSAHGGGAECAGAAGGAACHTQSGGYARPRP